MLAPGTYRLRNGTAMSNSTNNAIGAFFLMAGNLGDFTYGSGWGQLGYDKSSTNIGSLNKPVLMATGGADTAMYAVGFYDLARYMPSGEAYVMHAQGLDHTSYYGGMTDWKVSMQQMALAFMDARLMPSTFFRISAGTTALNNATATGGGSRGFYSNNGLLTNVGSTPIDSGSIGGMFAFRGAPVTSSGVIADGWYRFTPKYNSGLALDVANCGMGNNTNVGVYTWLNNDCQKFYVSAQGGGYYRIQPKVRSSSALNVASCGGAGANVALYDWANNDCQKFMPAVRGGGFIEFDTKYNSGLALDIANCGGPGANVGVWNDLNNDCQAFRLEPTL